MGIQNDMTNEVGDDEQRDDRFGPHVQPLVVRPLSPPRVPEAYRVGLYALKPGVTNDTPDLENFHVFTWIAAVQGSTNAPKVSSNSEKPGVNSPNTFKTYILDVNRYEKAKTEIRAFLNSKLRANETKTFRSTAEKAISDVAELHEGLIREYEQRNVDLMYDRFPKAEFAWAAKVVLNFFFPEHTEDPVLRKYWGAIHEILSFPVSKVLLCHCS